MRDDKPPTLDDDGIRERLEANPLPSGGVLIFGPTGTHKTHLACARAIDAARRGYSAIVVPWQRFCLEVRDTYKPTTRESEQDVLERYSRLDYLAIDDIGVGRVNETETAASLRLAHALLDERYIHCRTTDVTTNWRPGELSQRFDERIARRLDELCAPYAMLL